MTIDTDAPQYVQHLDEAVYDLSRVFGDGMFAGHVGPAVTCTEANVVAEVLLAGGHTDAAATWLLGHALEDDEGDSHDAILTHDDARTYIDEHLL